MKTGVVLIRVRYSETDQMGTFYNSRALEWFEVGRTETLRQMGMAYTEMEARGVMLPLVEAHVEYLGRAVYDDELQITAELSKPKGARFRFDITIKHAQSAKPVAAGYTVHAVTDTDGKVTRPPKWLLESLEL